MLVKGFEKVASPSVDFAINVFLTKMVSPSFRRGFDFLLGGFRRLAFILKVESELSEFILINFTYPL